MFRKETVLCPRDERALLLKVKYANQPQNKSRTAGEDAAEAGQRLIIHRETSPEPTWTERPLSQEEDITAKAT